MADLTGKVALVTGGASGIGASTPAGVVRTPLSDAAANITGEALNVSGGQQMH